MVKLFCCPRDHGELINLPTPKTKKQLIKTLDKICDFVLAHKHCEISVELKCDLN